MSFKRATLISDDNPQVSLRIAVKDSGDVYLKVMLGKAGSEIVHLAKEGSTNGQILDLLSEVVDIWKCDMPIGSTVKVDGITYVCTKSSDGCEGCAFKHVSGKCPDIYCAGDDRADGLDVFFKEK